MYNTLNKSNDKSLPRETLKGIGRALSNFKCSMQKQEQIIRY